MPPILTHGGVIKDYIAGEDIKNNDIYINVCRVCNCIFYFKPIKKHTYIKVNICYT